MCWFLTLAVADAALAALDRAAETHRRTLSVHAPGDTPTTRAFPRGMTCMEVTAGGCSCGIYRSPGSVDGVDVVRERAKLIAKGWSNAKVERALAAKIDSNARTKAEDTAPADFKALVTGLVDHAGTVVLHAHFHHGNQRSAEVPPPATATLSLDDFLRAGFAPDTLVTLHR
jgi:hypothetical protein